MKPVLVTTLYTILCLGTFADNVLASPDAYTEDLTKHRSVFSTPVADTQPPQHRKYKPRKKKHLTTVYDITPQLDTLLLDISAYHEMTKTIAGYTIQSYNGTNRKKALQIKDQLNDTFYPLTAEVKYKQPNFSVEMGVFLDILEAYPLYFRIKKRFPQTIIRPTTFPNKENLFDLVETPESHTDLLKEEASTPLHNAEETVMHPQDAALEPLTEPTEPIEGDPPAKIIEEQHEDLEEYSSVEGLH